MTDLPVTRSGAKLVGDTPWPPDVVELAFETWAFKTQRSVKQTVDFLNNLPDEWENAELESQEAWEALKKREMPYKTVYNWVISRKWEQKRADLMQTIAPAMHRVVEDELRIMTIDALRVQKELLLDENTPAIVRVKIIDSVLDRTGHQPFVRPKDDSKPRGPMEAPDNSLAGMTPDQLRDMLFGSLRERNEDGPGTDGRSEDGEDRQGANANG